MATTVEGVAASVEAVDAGGGSESEREESRPLLEDSMLVDEARADSRSVRLIPLLLLALGLVAAASMIISRQLMSTSVATRKGAAAIAAAASIGSSGERMPPFELVGRWQGVSHAPAAAVAEPGSSSSRTSAVLLPSIGAWERAATGDQPLQLQSFHWVDVWSGRCPDLFLSFLVDGSSRASSLLRNDGCINGSSAGHFSAVSDAELGLQQLLAFTSSSDLFIDLDNDHDLDLCYFQCRSSGQAPCTLQCALNSLYTSNTRREQQRGDASIIEQQATQTPRLPLFDLLQPEGRGKLPAASESSPMTAAVALDWNKNSWTEMLVATAARDEGQQLLSWTSIALLPATAVRGAHDIVAQERQSASLILHRCLRMLGSQSAACSMVARTEDVALPGPPGGCRALLMADMRGSADGDAAGPAMSSLICFGRYFPNDVHVFQATGKVSPAHRLQPTPMLSNPPASPLPLLHVCLADLNADGRDDMVLATEDQGLAVALSSGQMWRLEQLRPPEGDETDVTAARAVLSVACMDANNDGHVDVLALHGGSLTASPALVLYYNELDRDASFSAVIFPQQQPHASVAGVRSASGSLAVADWDEDGWLDVAVGYRSGLLELYHNTRSHQRAGREEEEAPAVHWLEVTLYGQRRSTSSSDGAIVTLHWADETAGSNMRRVLSASTAVSVATQGRHHQRLHFGLGNHRFIDRVEVKWHGGARMVYDDVQADQHLRIMHLWRPVIPPVFRGYHFRDDLGCSRPGHRRLRPSFFVLGQPKCGTTSLAAILSSHPLIRQSSTKEINYFPTLHEVAGLRWYAAQFPCGSVHETTFDATPSYLSKARVPAMLTAAFPDAKLVVVLRDPGARSFSLWKMWQRSPAELTKRLELEAAAKRGIDLQRAFHTQVSQSVAAFQQCVTEFNVGGSSGDGGEAGGDGGTLEAAQDACAGRAGALGGGLYAVLLARWLPLLAGPSSSLLVLEAEQLNSRQTVSHLLTVLGVERPQDFQLERRNEAPDSLNMLTETERLLQTFFAPFNERLSRQIRFMDGYSPSWLHYNASQS